NNGPPSKLVTKSNVTRIMMSPGSSAFALQREDVSSGVGHFKRPLQKEQAVGAPCGPVRHEGIVARRSGVAALPAGVNTPCFRPLAGLHRHAPRGAVAFLLRVDARGAPSHFET